MAKKVIVLGANGLAGHAITTCLNADDAYDVLAMRLTPEELQLVIKTEYKKIPQRDLQKVAKDLG